MVNKSLLVLSVAALAVASPVRRDATNNTTSSTELPSLSQNLQVAGESTSDALAAVGDSTNDVWGFAQQWAAKMSAPADLNTGARQQLWDGSHNFRVTLEYSLAVSQCQQPLARMVTEAPTHYCPQGGTCQYDDTLQTVSTTINQYGYTVSVLSAADENTLTTSPSSIEDWTSRKVSSASAPYQFNVPAGHICTPLSIQFSTTCQSAIDITNFELTDGNSGISTYMCDIFANPSSYAAQIQQLTNAFDNGSNFVTLLENICHSTTMSDPQGTIVLDLDQNAMTAAPLSVIGCSSEQ